MKNTIGADRPRAEGPVTAANWKDRANAFIRAKGLPPNDDGSHPGGYVIRPGSAQWTAWVEYLDAKGVPTKFARSHGVMTVPSEWPHEFEPDWVIMTPRPASSRRAKPNIGTASGKDLSEVDF